MEAYILQGMTQEHYSNYRLGGYDYCIEEITVLANSKEEALQKAKAAKTGLVINENSILTLEEYKNKIENEKKEKEEFWHRVEEEKQRKKDKELLKQIEKAQKLGLSLEQYQKYESLEKSIKRAEARKEKYFENLKSIKQGIEYENCLIAKRQEEIKKIFLNKE